MVVSRHSLQNTSVLQPQYFFSRDIYFCGTQYVYNNTIHNICSYSWKDHFAVYFPEKKISLLHSRSRLFLTAVVYGNSKPKRGKPFTRSFTDPAVFVGEFCSFLGSFTCPYLTSDFQEIWITPYGKKRNFKSGFAIRCDLT